MQIERPTARLLNPDEARNLEILKTAIAEAVADGVITADEVNHFKAILTNHRASHEELYQGMVLYNDLIRAKARRGELVIERSL
jgi:hypothetical protein